MNVRALSVLLAFSLFACADEAPPAPATPPPAPPPPIAAPPPRVLRANDPFDLMDEKVPAQRIDQDDDLFQGITPSDHWEGPSQADNADAPMQAYNVPKAVTPTRRAALKSNRTLFIR